LVGRLHPKQLVVDQPTKGAKKKVEQVVNFLFSSFFSFFLVFLIYLLFSSFFLSFLYFSFLFSFYFILFFEKVKLLVYRIERQLLNPRRKKKKKQKKSKHINRGSISRKINQPQIK